MNRMSGPRKHSFACGYCQFKGACHECREVGPPEIEKSETSKPEGV